MPLSDLLLLLLAGFAAGGMNALAGGGTFFSFPALLATGLPPVTANATNAVALWPASIAGAWAARSSLRPLGPYLLPLLAAGLAGGLGGGLLLLAGGDEVFRVLIPWLLLAATALFAASPWLSRLLAARRREATAVPPHGPLRVSSLPHAGRLLRRLLERPLHGSRKRLVRHQQLHAHPDQHQLQLGPRHRGRRGHRGARPRLRPPLHSVGQ